MAGHIDTGGKQPFLSHLKELRDRILVCVIAVGIVFIVTYYFKEKIFFILMEPFRKVMPMESSFIFTGVTEAFITYFKISIISALYRSAIKSYFDVLVLICLYRCGFFGFASRFASALSLLQPLF